MMSVPPRPKTVSPSSLPALRMRIAARSPSTSTRSPSVRASRMSRPSVPWTLNWSRAPSAPPRSASSWRTSDFARSPTSIRSCPPAALTSSVSTPSVSVVAGRVSRATRALPAKACSVNSSASAEPATSSRSMPAWPSIRSEPSSWKAVSSPAPRSTWSSPPPGATWSPSSPVSISSPAGPPRTVSAPAPVSIVVGSVSRPSIWTVSSPPPERIASLPKVVRSKLCVPTCNVVGEDTRTTIWSAAASPVMVSVPLSTEVSTAASAALGRAITATAARRAIRSIPASSASGAPRHMGRFPELTPAAWAAL